MRFLENKLIYKRAYFQTAMPRVRSGDKSNTILNSPTLRWCRDNHKNYIISVNPDRLIFDKWQAKNQNSFSAQQARDANWGIWSKTVGRAGVDTYLWTADQPNEKQPPYNDPIWKSGSWQNVAATIEAWMMQNSTNLEGRSMLWLAQCQLTPNFGSSIPMTESVLGGFLDPIVFPIASLVNTDYSARKLSALINPQLVKDVVKREAWVRLASVMQVDFPTEDVVRGIVGMNLSMKESGDWRA